MARKRAPVPVAEALRTHILEGKLPPGERLVELQLTEMFGASRAAVRAAISELVKEGLVDHEPNRGATVRRVAIDEAVQISEVRVLLESLIASRAAVKATSREREELSSIAASMREAVAADELVEYSGLNSLLHQRLREISRHDVAGRPGRPSVQPCGPPQLPIGSDPGPPAGIAPPARGDRESSSGR